VIENPPDGIGTGADVRCRRGVARLKARGSKKMKRVEGAVGGVGRRCAAARRLFARAAAEDAGNSDGGAYKEIGPWTPAQPSDRLPRDSWWTLYDNAELDELQKRLIAGNPTLAAALRQLRGRRRRSRDQARAGLFPTLGLAGVSARANRSTRRS
jgi:outer membrane protein TolC